MSPQATLVEITAAYRKLLRSYHPDVQPSANEPERLAAVLAAYRLLRDPKRRAEYDRQHRQSQPMRGIPIPVRVHKQPPAPPRPANPYIRWTTEP